MTQIRPADITRFTCGDCHIFARALNKLMGWPIYAFRDEEDRPDCHVFALRPDGKAVDIEGVHDLLMFIERWAGGGDASVVRQFEWSEFRCWDGPAFSNHSYARARQLAPLVAQA